MRGGAQTELAVGISGITIVRRLKKHKKQYISIFPMMIHPRDIGTCTNLFRQNTYVLDKSFLFRNNNKEINEISIFSRFFMCNTQNFNSISSSGAF